MAKALLVFALLTVFTVTGYRLLAGSQSYAQKAAKSDNKRLFKMDHKKIVEKLDELNAVVRKPSSKKDKENEKRTVLVDLLQDKQMMLEEEFYSQGDNFETLDSLRVEIKKLKGELDQKLGLTDTLSVEMIYYLILEQGMTFIEINNIEDLRTAGIQIDWTFSKSTQFKKAIYDYKNIEYDESEFSDRVPASYDGPEEESFDNSEEYYEE